MTMWFTCDLCEKPITVENPDERVQRANGRDPWRAPQGKDYCDSCGAAHGKFMHDFYTEWRTKQEAAWKVALEAFAATRKDPTP